MSTGLYHAVQTLRQTVERDGGAASLPEVDIHGWPSAAYRGHDHRHAPGPLPTQDEAKWQLDFLGRWKAKKYFLYTEAAIELDGYPLPHPEGWFSKEQIRRINTTILNEVGPNRLR